MSGAKGVSQVRAKGSSRVIARLSCAMSGARGVRAMLELRHQPSDSKAELCHERSEGRKPSGQSRN